MYLKKCDFCGVTNDNSDVFEIPNLIIHIEEDRTNYKISLNHVCKKCKDKMYDYMKSLITKETISQHERFNRQ